MRMLWYIKRDITVLTPVFVLEQCATVGAKVGSGTTYTVRVAELFGWTTFGVLAPRRTLALADTEAGVLRVAAFTQTMSQYRAPQLCLRRHKVRTSIVHILSVLVLAI